MVKEICEYIQGKVQAMGVFDKTFSLSELREDNDGKPYPMYYTGSGNYQPINASKYAGVAYMRKTEVTRFEDADTANSFVACEEKRILVLPLRLVTIAKRDRINCDQNFAPEMLAEELYRVLSGKSAPLATSAGVINAEVQISRIDTDSVRVKTEEYGQDFQIPYQYLALATEMEVRLEFDKGCMVELCETEY